MYHYVRPPPQGMPYFRYLHIDDFRRQLDHFTRSGGFVSREALSRILKGECELAEGYVLTFDDGLRDHWEFVVPELERRGIFGIFYVPTGQYGQDRLLDVHRVHCLVGALGGIEMLARPPAATSNFPTCGRVKLPHPRVAGRGMLGGGGARRNSRRGFLQPPALAFKLQEMPVVHEAVQ